MNVKVIILLLVLSLTGLAQQKKFLFDATKAETAGNADWIICASGGNPVRIPVPAQSGITQSTPETYWTGALSSWGIDLVKMGYYVEQLPPGASITYGNSSNAQDLSNYDVFIIDEPNSPFSASEKTALLNYVQNGGGLFMISDHNQSDRNGDGWDSPKIWNDLMTNNSVANNPFGISVDLLSFNDASTNVLSSTSDPLINGTAGTVTNIKISAGTTFTLNTAANSTVKGVIWKTGAAQSTTSVLCGYARYGNGKVVFVGDSSPADDGTGEAGKQLYPGWIGEANGDHRKLHLNGSVWLANKTTTSVNETSAKQTGIQVNNYPNPFSRETTVHYRVFSPGDVQISIYNALGRQIQELPATYRLPGEYNLVWSAQDEAAGVYFCRINCSGKSYIQPLVVVHK